MKKMNNQPKNVMVSFSKRRNGLVRKASELCLKCDAEVAVLVISQAGNAFAFGHPSADHIIRRVTEPYSHRAGVAIGDAIDVQRLRSKTRELDGLKARVKNAKGDLRNGFKAWIERKLEACQTLEELEKLKIHCLALRDKIAHRLTNDSSFLQFDNDNHNQVVDFSCFFKGDDHGLGGLQNNTSFPFDAIYHGSDYLLTGIPRGTPSSAEDNDGSFSMGKCVEVPMDQENDMSFVAELGKSTTNESNSGSLGTTESDDHVFDFLGQISCGLHPGFWD